MQADSLTGLQVLVTRPVHQAQIFCDMLVKHGAQAICLPAIEIKTLKLSSEMSMLVDQIASVNFAIFISPNAVELGLEVLLAHGKIPDTLRLVTIGRASAVKMQKILGRAADIYPTEQYNSEALLAMGSLQKSEVNNKNILIFRGQGGRELLAESLKQRGAKVDYIEVYQRQKPVLNKTLLKSIWDDSSNQHPDIITLTSEEGLNNLVALVKSCSDKQRDVYLAQMRQTPLIVVTERMRLSAQRSGFKNDIMIAQKASNEALLECVQEWFKTKQST